ncbi:N-acetylglucosamine-6-sulfatase-like [Cloeon dipterum]|uniref:N-acetylglucosamine-6-sulfatase-like n=1 Tax=Cloeon dipterum TaxID=197152 RepID=UPI0032207CF3
MLQPLLISLLFVSGFIQIFARPENIILILTDDQDLVKTGYTALPKTKLLLGDSGSTFTNAFATTPVCCPSRSSILTGRYLHNHRVLNNSISGGCASDKWREDFENNATFATHLKKQGYKTFYAGKYLNQYGKKNADVPKGWDWWFGLQGNSRYQNYTLSENGTWRSYGDRPEDYLTDVIAERALEFLNQGQLQNTPFLMVLATPAAHDPFTPAEKYKGRFARSQLPKGADFNAFNQGKHWLVQMPPLTLSNETISKIEEIYRHRLETLLSVDDLVEQIVSKLEQLQLLERTNLVFTSDHGYHLGQFAMPWDKRQPYDFDIRVPFLIRGPRIPKKKTFEQPILLTDLAPTFLQIAGIEDDSGMDGISLFKSIELEKMNRSFLIEFNGESHEDSVSPDCPEEFREKGQFFECNLDNACKCQDVRNNTYACVRHISNKCSFIFCHFDDDEDFEEFYDLNSDALQLRNVADNLQPHFLQFYRKSLKKLQLCSGKECKESGWKKVLCPDFGTD